MPVACKNKHLSILTMFHISPRGFFHRGDFSVENPRGDFLKIYQNALVQSRLLSCNQTNSFEKITCKFINFVFSPWGKIPAGKYPRGEISPQGKIPAGKYPRRDFFPWGFFPAGNFTRFSFNVLNK